MKQYHLKFDIPDTSPHDRPDWEIQAQGEIVKPLVNRHQPKRFWFTHYGGLKIGKHILIRYESESIADTTYLPIQPSEHSPFDIHSDLGAVRFLDPNQKSTSNDRGSKVFDFLHAASILTLDQLLVKNNGYWIRETSPDKANNHFGSPLESYHHLFCNLSVVETSVCIVSRNGILSTLYAKIHRLYSSETPVISVKF